MKKFWVGMIVFIIILILTSLQINLLNEITFFNTAADIGIIFVIGLGLICDKELGGIIGLVYGFIQDILFGKALGVYALLYMLIGYFSGKVRKKSFER